MKHSILAAASLLLCGSAAAQQEFQPRMGEPLPGLTAFELNRFVVGLAEFNTPLPQADGLGPAFNDVSCGTCHSHPAVGGFSTTVVTRFGDVGPPFDPLASLGGSLLQGQAISIPCEEQVPPSATVTAKRITPHAFGAGLVQRIPDADVLALESVPPGGSVSGIAHMVSLLEAPTTFKVGKFGWKNQVATMLTFSGDAAKNEMGLTNQLDAAETAPNGNAATLAACDTVADPEDSVVALGLTRIELFDLFQQFLAPPPQTPRSGMTGESLFNSVGCADCHVASFTTDATDPNPVFAGKEVRAYADFLLHDMGSLGDGIVQGQGTELEMRTMPLWGIGQREGLLHDGRSTGNTFEGNVHHATLEHAGEAQGSRDAYNALSLADQGRIHDFLRSLGRAEFDYENDNDVDEFDIFFSFFDGEFSGPAAGSFTPDAAAAVSDFDQDGDYDMADFEVLMRAFTGQ